MTLWFPAETNFGLLIAYAVRCLRYEFLRYTKGFPMLSPINGIVLINLRWQFDIFIAGENGIKRLDLCEMRKFPFCRNLIKFDQFKRFISHGGSMICVDPLINYFMIVANATQTRDRSQLSGLSDWFEINGVRLWRGSRFFMMIDGYL